MSEVFVISTQYLENYGGGSEDPYWKFKWGEDYIVTGCDRIQDAVAFICKEYSTVHSDDMKEFPQEWRTYDDWLDELSKSSDEYQKFRLEEAKKVEYKNV